jgi:nucleotide-binding universal stress UspA family protein
MKVLLALDGSRFSEAALNAVTDRGWPTGTIIRFISAFEIPLPATPEGWTLPTSYMEEIEAAGRRNAERIVDDAREQLARKLGTSVALESKVVMGAPKNVILEEADEWDADLIVLGSHGYSAWERFLLGSVSQGVVSHAKCSVEVVRLPRHKAMAA